VNASTSHKETETKRSRAKIPFAELAVTTNFSFLRGGSHPEELVRQAAEMGLAAVAVTDRNTLAGVVRGYTAARILAEEARTKRAREARKKKKEREKAPKVKYIVGCRLAFRDGTPDILAWPTDRAAYGRLCRLLTAGNLRAEKGQCYLDLSDLLEWGEGLILGVMDASTTDAADRTIPLRREAVSGRGNLTATLCELTAAFPNNVRLMASFTYGANDQRRLSRLARTAEHADVPLMATNDAHYHIPERRPLQDVLTCVREKTTLSAAGHKLTANAERHLKLPEEMARLFRAYPKAIAETMRVMKRINFSLDELQYQYPDEPTGNFASPQEALAHLAEEGARFRYPEGVPDKVRATLARELKIIEGRGYAPYFLTVHDIVRFARGEGILCQGRGSAANSVVCFCLGITEVDPSHANLLFERFISPNRNEPPDIDVDFEHERREVVMQYVFDKYGRRRAGIAATVISYRTRSAVRDVGKVFGLSEDAIGALASTTWGWSEDGVHDVDVRRAGLDPKEPAMVMVLDLSRQLIGFPRHLSQHVGGFVMTKDRLDEMVPVMNAAMEKRTHVEWDKDDLDALHMLKVDVLALGMLTCIKRAFDFLEQGYSEKLTLATIPKEDPAVYRMLGRADTVGVFQVESRAQMSMLPRLRPGCFYDLVIEVAIVRPGPIQGDMVHPYLRRREGIEPVSYPSPLPEHGDKDELSKILKRTLGVPLFQEQAMQIAMDAAKFTAAEADGLRRAMATFRRNGTIGTYQKRMIDGMTRRGYTRDFAERSFRQIEGFGDYGFPESHAASFALLVYASAWIKVHYPDVFCTALLNSQPMGFYAPAQIVRDAERHGVTVLPPDVNSSDWFSKLELLPAPTAQKELHPSPVRGGGTARSAVGGVHPLHASMIPDIKTKYAVRLGLHRIKGIGKEDAETLMAQRNNGYDSVRDLWLRTGIARAAIEHLADGDAFRSIGLDRRDALWAARGEGALKAKDKLPLFDVPEHADIRREPDFALPPMLLGEHVVNDYRYLSLSLKAHPLTFLRRELTARGIIPASGLRGASPAEDGSSMNGKRVTVSGLVITRQRPGTASGVIFMTLEDETDITNGIVWPRVFERYRPVVLGARLIALTGKVQSAKGVIHVVADRIDDLTPMLAALSVDGREISSLARADEVSRNPGVDNREKIRGMANHLMRHPRNEPVGRDLAAIAEAAHEVMPKGRNFH
jgi:error-prone DNA polymerase